MKLIEWVLGEDTENVAPEQFEFGFLHNLVMALLVVIWLTLLVYALVPTDHRNAVATFSMGFATAVLVAAIVFNRHNKKYE